MVWDANVLVFGGEVIGGVEYSVSAGGGGKRHVWGDGVRRGRHTPRIDATATTLMTVLLEGRV